MKRKIIQINEERCNGCGLCIPNCPEGALQIIDGKVRLISDLFCDGLGACIGYCPEEAITIVEREAEVYDEAKVMENIVKQGRNVIKAHLEHLKEHNETEYLNQAIKFLRDKGIENPIEKDDEHNSHKHSPHSSGCPGSKIIDFSEEKQDAEKINDISIKSEIRQWPIQLQLLNPNAPYFKNADLLIAADCVPFTFANFHQKLLKGKILIIFCPKLDSSIEQYVDKLTEIFKHQNILSITLAHMEVPCCSGIESIVKKALEKSGKDITIIKYIISLRGDILSVSEIKNNKEILVKQK